MKSPGDSPGRIPIPDGSMINGEITVTSYFDIAGVMRYGVHVEGDFNLAQAIGLLELAKIEVFRTYTNQTEEEDDGEDQEFQ